MCKNKIESLNLSFIWYFIKGEHNPTPMFFCTSVDQKNIKNNPYKLIS